MGKVRSAKGTQPTFAIELEELGGGEGLVCGVDEAGRGPLAGPVVAAAVCVTDAQMRSPLPAGLQKLNDSKALNEEVRAKLFDQIVETFEYAIGVADVDRIDRENILQATMWAMRQSVSALDSDPDVVLVDGNRSPGLKMRTRVVVGGDAQCLSIAAASVIAKVTRDRMMIDLAAEHPDFGFEKHKGYGTKAHLEALSLHGPTVHHRRSFRPVRVALGLDA